LDTQKAVVLARGLGKRMRRERPDVGLGPERERLAAEGLKPLMPLGGRPFLDYIVDALLRAGLRRICLVIAPDAHAMRQHALRIQEAADASIECAVQQRPLGTADAVLAAEAFASGDPFVLCNGDNLYPDRALKGLAELNDAACWLAAFDRDELLRCGNIPGERLKDFAVVAASAEGRLLGIAEKPPEPERYVQDGKLWVSMNLYRFTAGIFDSCRSVKPHPLRGELELTAAVAGLLESGQIAFRVLFCGGGIVDLTSRADIAVAERALKGRQLSF